MCLFNGGQLLQGIFLLLFVQQNRPGQNVARVNFHINQRAKQHSFSDPFSLHVLLCALISKIATREQIAIKRFNYPWKVCWFGAFGCTSTTRMVRQRQNKSRPNDPSHLTVYQLVRPVELTVATVERIDRHYCEVEKQSFSNATFLRCHSERMKLTLWSYIGP